jgi:hypothetical protein
MAVNQNCFLPSQLYSDPWQRKNATFAPKVYRNATMPLDTIEGYARVENLGFDGREKGGIESETSGKSGC